MKHLRLVEIELWSYCNRQCSWCPNSFIDRHSETKYINEKIFKHIIETLKINNYNGYITFSRYNEPLAYPDTLNKVCKYIKRELPNCILVTNTNGDYLSKEIIQSLNIDELSIMDYNNKGMQLCIEELLKYGCKIDKIVNNFIYGHYKNMKILYYVDWKNNCIPGNRGGILPFNMPIRTYPCYEPKYFIGINYDGTVSPCCNIRNDIYKQKKYIIGDLNKESLYSILKSKTRKNIIDFCQNTDFSPCSPCYRCTNTGGRYTRDKGGIEYE